ncbi:MAG: hypothetical protein ACP5NK_06985 [Thermoplasmata archaeon]
MPFVRYIPETLAPLEISYRGGQVKWPTFRYFVNIGDRRYRVKQFFLDWFYPGFPKSLMSSFMGTFSEIRSMISGDRIFFTGKDYRGRNAASSFINGTQVEVEATGESEEEDFSRIFSDLKPVRDDVIRLRGSTFRERSYFASGRSGTWFEDQRISRLHWIDHIDASFELNGKNYELSSTGVMLSEGRIGHCIMVFEGDSFERAGWIDVARKDSEIPYGYYEFRDEEGMFDHRDLSDISVLLRSPSGPGIVRWSDSEMLYTMSISPLLNFPDADEMKRFPAKTHGIIKDVLEQVSGIY